MFNIIVSLLKTGIVQFFHLWWSDRWMFSTFTCSSPLNYIQFPYSTLNLCYCIVNKFTTFQNTTLGSAQHWNSQRWALYPWFSNMMGESMDVRTRCPPAWTLGDEATSAFTTFSHAVGNLEISIVLLFPINTSPSRATSPFTMILSVFANVIWSCYYNIQHHRWPFKQEHYCNLVFQLWWLNRWMFEQDTFVNLSLYMGFRYYPAYSINFNMLRSTRISVSFISSQLPKTSSAITTHWHSPESWLWSCDDYWDNL